MEEFLKNFNKPKLQITQNLVSDKLFEKVYNMVLNYENKFFFTNKKQFQDLYEQFTNEVKDWYNSLDENEKNQYIPENKDENVQINLAVFKAVKKLLRNHLLKT